MVGNRVIIFPYIVYTKIPIFTIQLICHKEIITSKLVEASGSLVMSAKLKLVFMGEDFMNLRGSRRRQYGQIC